eukprot:CAMPEP_0197486758 /NCGR_PEP_ID=MMETSP1311-20131121/1731_1 /TAXON_ID=464262 /ORGANISM="Genus nov. species nov., Strain RCC856" /LENGTH=255 /DNA_ID=CAMNT_0043030039 /DNA_START=100 /DNA_END=867 /DNA_ORIENTATION=-
MTRHTHGSMVPGSASRHGAAGLRCRGGTKGFALCLLALLCVLLARGAQAMSFDMQFQTKCFFQDIENGQASTIEWRAISKSSVERNMAQDNVFSEEDAEGVPLNVVVQSPVPRAPPLENIKGESEGKVYINADHGEEVEGDYKICFTAPSAEGAKDIKLLLNWRVGALAQDWEVLAKKEHIDHISIELQKYEDLVKEMRQEMLHMKKVDKVALQTREAAHKRVEYFSLLTMFVCIGFTVGQYFFLKRFFKNKKLL